MSKEVHIIGAGLAGCCLARVAAENGCKVIIYEAAKHVGGICREKEKGGIRYHPLGPHVFHSHLEERTNFFKRFTDVVKYVQRTKTLVRVPVPGGIDAGYASGYASGYVPWPPTQESIEILEELVPGTKAKIEKELAKRPESLDMGNFETCVRTLVGDTLYELFIKNYTEKFWKVPATELSSEWAPKRMDVRPNYDDRVFKDQIQFMPDYNKFFENVIDHENITVLYKRSMKKADAYRLAEEGCIVVWTGNLDRLRETDKLRYTGPTIHAELHEVEEYQDFPVINYPNDTHKYHRITEYKKMTGQKHPHTVITKEYPGKSRMYPINTKETAAERERLVMELAEEGKVIPYGRLGLYRYLDMHIVVGMGLYFGELVGNWHNYSVQERKDICRKLLEIE